MGASPLACLRTTRRCRTCAERIRHDHCISPFVNTGTRMDVEALLTPQARARLPFPQQVILYLDPFAFFKAVPAAPARAQELCLAYNRAMRWMLLAYMRRWIIICTGLFLGIAPAEAMAAQVSFFILPAAALAVGSCIAATVLT